MTEETICYKVTFKPVSSWADETYLGNMLTEVLAIMARNTSAFEFEIENLSSGTEDSDSAT